MIRPGVVLRTSLLGFLLVYWMGMFRGEFVMTMLGAMLLAYPIIVSFTPEV